MPLRRRGAEDVRGVGSQGQGLIKEIQTEPSDIFASPESEENFKALVSAVEGGRATAFLGAGLGKQAGLPGWPELLEDLCQGNEEPTGPFNAQTAPDDFETVRQQLVGEYLPRLREILDPPGLQIPDTYRVLADIPFKRFATTSLDELLFLLATIVLGEAEELVHAYPSLGILDCRHYYLHGRLRTASSDDDIVLCSSDYACAYDGEMAPAKHALVALLHTPLIFIAASLSDPDIQHVMTVLQRNRTLRGRSGELETQVYLSRPSWYALLAAHAENLVESSTLQALIPQNELVALMAERERILHPVKVIWYRHDPTHSQLKALLERLRFATRKPATEEEPFMASARELEELAALTSPKPDQIEKVLGHLAAPTHARHFFRYATASWLPILWARGHLRQFTDPQLGSDGNYRVSEWDAADFVGRSASAYPDVVLQMIREIETDNWLVVYGLARALENLPADKVSQAIPAVDGWLSRRFAFASPASMALSGLLKRLVSEQEWDAALALFGVLVKWKVIDDEG